jgi:uncharacterized membrane protein YfcA
MPAGDLALIAATLLVGVLAGMLSALLGVGGAVLSTPAVRLLGATPIESVGSTVPAILPGAITGTIRYAKAGLVDWRTALGLGISGSVFAVAGALTAKLVENAVGAGVLMILTAVMMFWSGVTVVRAGRRADRAAAALVAPVGGGLDEVVGGIESAETDTALIGADTASAPVHARHGLAVLSGLGAGAGFVAGLLGVGGGVVLVPLMTGPLRIPAKTAVASSLVAVAIFSVPALVTHSLLGTINWVYALPLMIGVVPGARIGSRITVRLSERAVSQLFGIMIAVMAVLFAVSEVVAYLR